MSMMAMLMAAAGPSIKLISATSSKLAISMSLGTTAEPGDLILYAGQDYLGNSFGIPSGFTPLYYGSDGPFTCVAYKIAVGGETTTGCGGTVNTVAVYRKAIIGAFAKNVSPSGFPALTLQGPGSSWVHCIYLTNGASQTPATPPGLVQRATIQSPSEFANATSFDTNGPVSSFDGTAAGFPATGVNFSIELKPAA